ncbi:MAG: hypothetical protein H7Y37_10880 [Anaerolineae bacterium]|nr:hypothetical protein [Gloeobacterales cyanobacterium ES-bin-313]
MRWNVLGLGLCVSLLYQHPVKAEDAACTPETPTPWGTDAPVPRTPARRTFTA